MLINSGLIPIMIFDGNKIPIKGKEESAREFKRSMLRQKANTIDDNKKSINLLIQSIDVTPEMVHTFTLLLNEMGVEYIVARNILNN